MLAMSLSAHDPTETWAARLLQRKSIVRSFAKALSFLYCMHTTSGGRGRMAIDIRRRELGCRARRRDGRMAVGGAGAAAVAAGGRVAHRWYSGSVCPCRTGVPQGPEGSGLR